MMTYAGTVKTSMDHPSQGKTQMFRRGLDDAGFQQVRSSCSTCTCHHNWLSTSTKPVQWVYKT